MESTVTSQISQQIYSAKLNKLYEGDIDVASELFEINIFNTTLHVAPGKSIKGDDDLVYFYVYAIKDEKVVANLGVYELNTDDQKMLYDISTLENLLLFDYYYTNPTKIKDFEITGKNNIFDYIKSHLLIEKDKSIKLYFALLIFIKEHKDKPEFEDYYKLYKKINTILSKDIKETGLNKDKIDQLKEKCKTDLNLFKLTLATLEPFLNVHFALVDNGETVKNYRDKTPPQTFTPKQYIIVSMDQSFVSTSSTFDEGGAEGEYGAEGGDAEGEGERGAEGGHAEGEGERGAEGEAQGALYDGSQGGASQGGAGGLRVVSVTMKGPDDPDEPFQGINLSEELKEPSRKPRISFATNAKLVPKGELKSIKEGKSESQGENFKLSQLSQLNELPPPQSVSAAAQSKTDGKVEGKTQAKSKSKGKSATSTSVLSASIESPPPPPESKTKTTSKTSRESKVESVPKVVVAPGILSQSKSRVESKLANNNDNGNAKPGKTFQSATQLASQSASQLASQSAPLAEPKESKPKSDKPKAKKSFKSNG